MSVFNLDASCRQAELYYYDFLDGNKHRAIPSASLEHIQHCESCRENVSRLLAALSDVAEHPESQQGRASAMTTMLKLQFSYIGERVTCNTVKPFLPCLADPTLAARIPTPITVHLDNCSECSNDLATIRDLGLRQTQLYRLSRLLAQKPSQDSIECSRAQAIVPDIMSAGSHEAGKEVLNHLCVCRDCRRLFYEYLQRTQEKCLSQERDAKPFDCERLSEADIFDLVLPYGLDAAGDTDARTLQASFSHVRSCARCLAKMQRLHKTVCTMCDRAESDVVTIYRMNESAETQATADAENLYAGFPVQVEVASRQEAAREKALRPRIDFRTLVRQYSSRLNLIPLMKVTAAAAVVLMGVILLFNAPAARALSFEQVYEAVQEAMNVHIVSFVPGRSEPVEERWVSRSLNVYLAKTADRLVLWEPGNSYKKTRNLDTGSVQTARLPEDISAAVRAEIRGALGLLPFADIADASTNAKWIPVGTAGASDSEVYDLEWTKKTYRDAAVHRKCRVFVDPKTNLPQKIQFYAKPHSDRPYTLRSEQIVKYLSEAQVRNLIQQASF
jgi:hypothetical protein